MSDVTHAEHGLTTHHRRRGPVVLAALFTGAAAAGVVAHLAGHATGGTELLIAAVPLLLGTMAFRTAWARRHSHPPPATAPPRCAEPPAPVPARGAEDTDPTARTALWRLRTTVRDAPGSLAAVCTAMARRRIDVVSVQTHPLTEGTVDEFLLRVPAALSAADLTETVAAAGGGDTWTERADTHDLVDAPTRALGLAIRTALDPAELPLALRRLLGRCTIRSQPPLAVREIGARQQGCLDGTVMRLPAPDGGTITVERPHLPFTPAEFARARALVDLDARLGPRLPEGRDVLTLPRGAAVTIRRADTADLDAAKQMHARCSAHTLDLRYHGPVGDADRYLKHLLSPSFGRTLAAQTASGRIVALGHLLWDGDESEVALLVEDEWQGRGIGGELLGRLVSMAAEAGSENVYAVTRASNTGVVAAMRGLGLPLDYQIEDGTVVVAARLAPPGATPPPQPPPSTDSPDPAEDPGHGLPGSCGEPPRHHGTRS